jgi:Fe-S-cluster containining protein
VRNRVHRRRRNLSRATTPSCEGCGACCLSHVWGDGTQPQSPFVDVFESELHFYRPEELVERSDGSSTWRVLRVEGGRCFALVGEVPGGRCAIYDRRPATCSGFEPGNYRCRVARARAGVGPSIRGA